MTTGDTPKETEAGPKVLSVRFSPEDLARFKEAARVLGEREHLDLLPIDIVRSGARRFADEVLGDAAA